MRLVYLWLTLSMICLARAAADKCESCGRIVEAFSRGLERTAKANFGGGNTHWEESRLGTYAYSETRLVDIMERLCNDESKDDALICHSILENLEETIESWWAKEFKANSSAALGGLRQFLCVSKAGLCCPYNHFGPECKQCPSSNEGATFCSGRGSCDGNGTKTGTGVCHCHYGYAGQLCSDCASGFYSNATDAAARVQCAACDAACSRCLGPTSANCTDCASGYEQDEAAGSGEGGQFQCRDVDECSTKCKGENEICTNTQGSFTCECSAGFRRENDTCVKEEAAEKQDEEREAEGDKDEQDKDEKNKDEKDNDEKDKGEHDKNEKDKYEHEGEEEASKNADSEGEAAAGREGEAKDEL